MPETLMEKAAEAEKEKISGTRLTYRQRQDEKERLESFLKMWNWIDSYQTTYGNEIVLTADDWQLVCAAAGRIKRDYENALVRVRKAKEKRQGSGNGSVYTREKRHRLDAQTEFCKWTQEKKPVLEPFDSNKQVYLLKPEETELLAHIAEIIEDKLKKSRLRAAQVAIVRKPIPIAAKSLGGQKGSEGKGKNGKGKAGRKEDVNPSSATLAKRRQREREKLTMKNTKLSKY